jgi:hypothetical protein
MTYAWFRPAVIVTAVVILLSLNAHEFRSKRRALEAQYQLGEAAGTSHPFARQQALQAQTIEQLLHMIHTMLAAILAALLWQ